MRLEVFSRSRFSFCRERRHREHFPIGRAALLDPELRVGVSVPIFDAAVFDDLAVLNGAGDLVAAEGKLENLSARRYGAGGCQSR